MDFLLKKKKDKIVSDEDLVFFPSGVNNKKDEYVRENEKLIVLGDLVSDLTGEAFVSMLFNTVRDNKTYVFGGFYYIIYINSEQNSYKIFSCLFNILPIYYSVYNNELFVSSKISLIKKNSDITFSVNKQYILERSLFNYGLFDNTYWKEISLVPSNSSLLIKNDIIIQRNLSSEDLFSESPSRGKKVLEDLSQIFISTSKKYFSLKKFAVSFTSGFDGRTLVSVAKGLNKNFVVYSFGKKNSDDITFPEKQSEKLKLDYRSIALEMDYVENYSFKTGLELIEKTEGEASFSRAHYLYAANNLSTDFGYIITGNFGSELFRAFHAPGVVISSEIINFFINSYDSFQKSYKLHYLNFENFNKELKEVSEKLFYYKQNYKNLNLNAFFYVFILEEVFRKYFGPEIVMQRNFLYNRAPFLDFHFICKLFNTYYSGVYSKFMTNNPLKRYKGQLLYAYIIKNSFPEMLELKTGKGYKPADLLSISGKFKLIKSKTLKHKHLVDPYSVRESFDFNKNKIRQIKIQTDFYNDDIIKKKINSGTNLDNLILILSSNYYLSLNQ